MPTITSLTNNADGSMLLTGTGLNGLDAGAAYGDDAQMDTNYPLVRLVNGFTFSTTLSRAVRAAPTGINTARSA